MLRMCRVGEPRRCTHHTVRNNAGRKTVIAFRTRASSEPLSDRLGVRLGVVCTYLGCWPVDSLPRRRRNFVGESSPPFASHHACKVRNDVCVKTVMASRTRASSEPLPDMLGVVWTESCAIFYIEWCRKYEGYNACVDGVTHFLTHHLCLPRKFTNKTQRYGWTSIYGNDRNRILCNAVLDGICQWTLVRNLLRII